MKINTDEKKFNSSSKILNASLAGFLLCSSLASAGQMNNPPTLIMGFKPVISLLGGITIPSTNGGQTFFGTDDAVFIYNKPSSNNVSGVIGLELSAESQLSYPGLFMQAGVEYNYFWSSKIHGSHTVGDESVTSTGYTYHYNLQAQQVLAVAKLLGTVKQNYHPYFMIGLGASFNKTSGYDAVTQEIGSINLAPTFNNHTQSAFSYALGVGVDEAVNEHVRIGLGYRFSDLGKSSLGKGQVVAHNYAFPVPFSPSSSHTYMNQFIAQVSYIA